jgi:hypothetical protein
MKKALGLIVALFFTLLPAFAGTDSENVRSEDINANARKVIQNLLARDYMLYVYYKLNIGINVSFSLKTRAPVCP